MGKFGHIYRFGPFQLDTTAHRLLKDNTPVSLAPKSFDLLQVLLENEGRAMSKAELLEALWPDAQVEEGNLAFQVSVLRKALGSEASSWIETVPRHGYRLNAPVVVDPVVDVPVSASGADITQKRVPRHYLAAALVLFAIAAGILIATNERTGAVASGLNSSRHRALGLRAVPLTAFHGAERDPAVSPDGKYVAFAWDGERQDNFDIYVLAIGTGTPHRVTTDPAQDMSPAWSPDGRSIAFLRRLDDHRAALLLVPSAGGPEHRLGETRTDTMRRPRGLASLGWSPDGRWVAASHREAHQPHEGIHLFSLTGEKRRLTTPPEDSHGDHMPAFSPDGRKLAFCRLLGFASSEVYVLALEGNYQPGSTVRRLTNHKRWSVNPVWVNGSGELLYVFSQNPYAQGPREVRVASTSEAAASERTIMIDELGQISASKHLVYSQGKDETNIWRARIPAPGEKPGTPELFISSTALDGKARYSPDGRKIAFVSSRSGSEELWISNADGSGQVRVTFFGGPLIGPPAWSPDGQWLVFHARPEGQADLFVVPAAGGPPGLLAHHPSDENQPTYSRDGQWIYFNSVRNGQLQVFRMPSAGGGAVQITTRGGMRPIESPDGKTLFYVSDRGNAIRQVPVNGGVEADIVTSVCPEFGFALTSDGLLYPERAATPSGNHCDFRLLTLATRQSRPVARTAAIPLGRIVSISLDGTYFIFEQAERHGMDLMLIENFFLR